MSTKSKTQAAKHPKTNAKTAKAKKAKSNSAVPASADATTTATEKPATEKLSKLDVPELQALYLEVVGRPTSSSNKLYLIWKIREARKGHIPLGPRKPTQRKDGAFMVLPLRMESQMVEKIDQAWRRHGLATRTALLRKALHDFFVGIGEHDVAELLFTSPQGEA
jgi:hypothetical protein